MLSDITSDFNTDIKSENASFLKLDDADHFILVPNKFVGKNRRAYLHLGTNNIYNISVCHQGKLTASYEKLDTEDKITPFAKQCTQAYC